MPEIRSDECPTTIPDPASYTLTTTKVARGNGVSPSTVVRYANRGLLRCRVLPTGARRFRREDVAAVFGPQAD